MHRRSVLAGLAALPFLSHAAQAAEMVDYTDGLIKAALAEGKTVFVDYAASWCSTCARQERVIAELQAETPAYLDNVLFVRVDWDQYKSAPITTMHKIPRRSTLIVLKGDAELGRIVAGTSKADIKALMDTALAASTGA